MQIRTRGNLFVFEGPDGSGKTTLSSAFVEYLKGKGIECDQFAFPGREAGTLGKLVHNLHHDPQSVGVEFVNPTSLQLLHVAAHLDAIESRILPALRKGRTVVLDRFWWSTWVYGRVGRANPKALQKMIQLEKVAWGNVRPTTVFLLRRKPLLHASRTRNDEKLSKAYLTLATREAHQNSIRFIENEGSPLPPSVFTRINPAKPTVVFDTYWRFAAERQAIFFRRLNGAPPPWTDDPVLSEYKFTNSYRASDRVSQYLIRNVIYKRDQSPEELFFRIILFKFFNKIETWELLENEIGELSFADYSYEQYDDTLNQAINRKSRIYSAAYIMPSGGSLQVSKRKHQMHLRLLEQMMRDELPLRLAEACSMRQAFELLRSYPTIGDFLAYQYVTDLNYSTLLNFSEMDFVVPGPGARDGIRKCFSDLGGLNETEIIKVVTDRQQAEFDHLGLEFQSLWGRPLQLIDCQNVFCEVDKYARVNHPDIAGLTGRTRIKQRYRINREPISVWYPPKWGLNERISTEDKYVSSV